MIYEDNGDTSEENYSSEEELPVVKLSEGISSRPMQANRRDKSTLVESTLQVYVYLKSV